MEVSCMGHLHGVLLEEDGDEIVARFVDHDDIEKDTLIATIKGELGGCHKAFLELTGKSEDGPLTDEMAQSLRYKQYGRARWLLEAGANPNVTSHGWPIVFVHADERKEKNVSLLLEYGADPNAKTRYGETVLHRAASKGLEATVHKLLKAGADPNARMEGGDAPLNRGATARENNGRIIWLLVRYGAEVNATNDSGSTALHHAAAHGRLASIRQLLKAGADPHKKDESGNTPAALAWREGNPQASDMLKQAMKGK